MSEAIEKLTSRKPRKSKPNPGPGEGEFSHLLATLDRVALSLERLAAAHAPRSATSGEALLESFKDLGFLKESGGTDFLNASEGRTLLSARTARDGGEVDGDGENDEQTFSNACSATGVENLKIVNRVIVGGVIKVTDQHIVRRMRHLLICRAGFDPASIQPNAQFPPSVGPSERVKLRPFINGLYYDDVQCGVSGPALHAASTPAAMFEAISNAIHPDFHA